MKIDSVSNNAARSGGNTFEGINRQEARQAARQERIEARQAARQERIEARQAARQERIEARQERLAAREARGNQPSVPTGPIPVEPDGGIGDGAGPIPLTLLEEPTPIDPGVGGFNIPFQFGGPRPIDPGFGGGTIFPPVFQNAPSEPTGNTGGDPGAVPFPENPTGPIPFDEPVLIDPGFGGGTIFPPFISRGRPSE